MELKGISARRAQTSPESAREVTARTQATESSIISSPATGALWQTAARLLALRDQASPIARLPDDGPAPLSFAQERLWWLEQLEPGAPYYNVPLGWDIQGNLNVPALERSLNHLVQRHESLRTSFPSSATGPVQRVGDWELKLEVPTPESLVRAGPEGNGAGARAAALARARAWVQRPFDLTAGPLFRAVLYPVEPRRHLLVLLVHQMVFDGASMRILGRELDEAYGAFAAGRTPDLPELPVRYTDFAQWQRQNLRDEVLRRALEFWRGQCRQAYAPLHLPGAQPRRERPLTPGAQVPVALPRALTERLKRLGRGVGVTPFAALLGSFQAFLAQETGRADVLALVTVAGRNQRELRPLIGLVANVLPMRVELSGRPSFNEVLHRSGQVLASALAHQSLPLERILELLPASGVTPDASALQVAVLYYHQPLPGFRLPRVTFTPLLELDNGTAKSELTLDIFDSPEGVGGCLKYRADLFERATIERLLRDWRVFLQHALEAPTQPLWGAERVGHTSAAPEPATARTPASPVAPRNPVEATLVELWESVLATRPIGVHDRFLALGGHSLLALRLNFRIREAFGVELPMHCLFEEQTIAALAEGLAAGRWKASAAGNGRVAPAPRAGPLPLSFAQERLWFIDQLEPNSPLYNVPVLARLRGRLDLDALERTLNALVARHEALRTRFANGQDGPVQVVEPEQTLRVRPVDLVSLPEGEREPEAERLLKTEANRPFNLGTGPLLRVLLLRLKPDEHLLVLNLHHIVSDEWSLRVLFRDLATLYSALVRKEAPRLPDLPVQYADYAVWQRQWLQGTTFERQLGFWKARLGGNPPVTELPSDYPRGSRATFRGTCQTRPLPLELSRAVAELAQRQRVTLFMVLLAAFKVLLHRYTQQEDIIIGSPIAGRSQAETENLIGFFANTLLLRTDLSGDPTFSELLQRVSAATLAAYAHQDAPFNRVVQTLQPERSLRHLPFSSILFVLQSSVLESLELPALRAEFLELATDTSKFDVTLFIQETSRGLVARIEYNADLFESATITRLLRHFEVLLGSITTNADLKVSALPLMPDSEKNQVLLDWNRTGQDYPREQTLVDLFEAQVARTPEAEALVCGDTRLTYRELDARSNRVGQLLSGLGVTAEVPVGICLERSWEMVAGILGVLKAGGCYVPLDTAYPPERLAFMLKDSGARVLLTQRQLLEAVWPEGTAQPPGPQREGRTAEPTILCLDSLERLADSGTITSSASPSRRSSSLAYVIYTSGSTGKPKGVALEDRGAVALMHWAKGVYSAQALSGVLAATSICFDLSVFELFVPLSWGGKVILADNALDFEEWATAGEVTLVNTVPSVMRELLRLKALPGSVRVVNLAGEALSSELVDQIYRETPVEKVYDLYGPTETTTYSTFTLRRAGAAPSIGRPLANEQVYVLDPHLQPAPVGVPGELCIGGVGLARGYVNRPELTAERFVATPFALEGRVYRTGDLARWRANGTLEYLGRLDHQVKVRGHRVELGEIESVLRSMPGVAEAVVLAREDTPGDKRLVAYVVPGPGQELGEPELRQFLQHKLPSYMVPGCCLLLEQLPFTPNGKVDRQALPRPADASAAAVSAGYVAPRSPLESALVEMWGQLLERKQVGIHDNFFQLGGHSLLATQVISRLAGQFKVQVPLRAIFEGPTVAALAEAIRRAQSQQPTVAPAIVRRVRGLEAEAVLARLPQLSDAEVEALLHEPTLQPGAES